MLSVRIATLFDTPPQARMSAQDYIASPQSEHKSDLIEGVFVMASPASFEHEDIQLFIGALLRNFVNARRLGVVVGSNAAYRLNEGNVYQPDISFLEQRTAPPGRRSLCPRRTRSGRGGDFAQQPPVRLFREAHQLRPVRGAGVLAGGSRGALRDDLRTGAGPVTAAAQRAGRATLQAAAWVLAPTGVGLPTGWRRTAQANWKLLTSKG